MVSTLANQLYIELRKMGIESFFKDRGQPQENRSILNEIFVGTNITKSSYSELEISYPGTVFYLEYLLDSGLGIDFGICPFFKMWHNQKGGQTRCRFNTGPVQVYCSANRRYCEHPKEYDANISGCTK